MRDLDFRETLGEIHDYAYIIYTQTRFLKSLYQVENV